MCCDAAIPPSTVLSSGSAATFFIICNRAAGDDLDAGVSVAKNARYCIRIALVVSAELVGEVGLVDIDCGLGEAEDDARDVTADVAEGRGPPEASTPESIEQPVNASATSSAAEISARRTVTGI